MPPCKVAGFDLIVVETSGIGQGDAAIVPHVDVPMYVMTPEFGAASQLEKIDMLDFAEFVAINKFDRKGAQDALRDVAKQVQRNKEAWGTATGPDAGVWHHGQPLQRRWRDCPLPGHEAAPGRAGPAAARRPPAPGQHPPQHPPDPGGACAARTRYLAEIADTVRGYKKRARQQATLAREIQQLLRAARGCCWKPTPTRTALRLALGELAEAREAQMEAPAPAKLLKPNGPTCKKPMPATSTW